ncbi:dihydrofolate reductase family protein [Halorussus halophilus]|uniref:dihydrofolate reductase family protein n=1 Tax=Halorussus halophilus TaxID=2650975 RepID=UPI0013011A18|nr:dihydrofolate reductase family protein [Halorussus halophilus]
MGKLIATTFVTLDDRMVGPNEEMDWVTDNFDDEMGEDIDDVHDVSTFVFGRTTYGILAGYWPTASEEEEGVMAQRLNTRPKVVFSETLEEADWNNTRIVSDDLETEVENLKQQDGDSLIIGSASIVQTCTNLGLLDEYWLWVHPVILGEGKLLFEDIEHRVELDLTRTKTYDNDVTLLQYSA